MNFSLLGSKEARSAESKGPEKAKKQTNEDLPQIRIDGSMNQLLAASLVLCANVLLAEKVTR